MIFAFASRGLMSPIEPSGATTIQARQRDSNGMENAPPTVFTAAASENRLAPLRRVMAWKMHRGWPERQ